jgi:hypothetical protein
VSNNGPITLAAVSDRHVLLRGINADHWSFRSFNIAPEDPSFDRLLDSAFSSPGRYIQEIFSRLVETAPSSQSSGRFIFNPYFVLTRSSLLTTVAILRKLNFKISSIIIIADSDECPVGYFLPYEFDVADAHYLVFLSAVNASLDKQLLQSVCFLNVEIHTLDHLRLFKTTRNGFDDRGMPKVYAWITKQAIQALVAIKDPDISVVRAARLSIPVTAFMPHHAGDVLFFCLAFNYLNLPCERIAVNRAYVDIVQSISPRLTPVILNTSPLNRGSAFAAGVAMRDDDYFETIVDQLPTDSLYIYCRPSRNYNTTEFHLLDHFGFALGYSPRSKSQLLVNCRPPLLPFKSTFIGKTTARILLHFDGGWALKVYPAKQQSELIEMLLLRGYQITVLASAGYSYPGVRAVTFSSLQHFDDLVRSQDAIIGMDSFPCHYCTHVLGMPTICLFANTKPVNSNAVASARYIHMEKGLSCRPCYAITKCPVYGGNSCKNFSDPTDVVEQLIKLLSDVMPAGVSLNDSQEIATSALPAPITVSLNLIEFQLYIARFFPETSYLRLMFKEFTRAVRREGLYGAFTRTMRFLIRRRIHRK